MFTNELKANEVLRKINDLATVLSKCDGEVILYLTDVIDTAWQATKDDSDEAYLLEGIGMSIEKLGQRKYAAMLTIVTAMEDKLGFPTKRVENPSTIAKVLATNKSTSWTYNLPVGMHERIVDKDFYLAKHLYSQQETELYVKSK